MMWSSVNTCFYRGKCLLLAGRKGAGAVELACLENKCAGNGTEGSNPSPSATDFVEQIECENYYSLLPLFSVLYGYLKEV